MKQLIYNDDDVTTSTHLVLLLKLGHLRRLGDVLQVEHVLRQRVGLNLRVARLDVLKQRVVYEDVLLLESRNNASYASIHCFCRYSSMYINRTTVFLQNVFSVLIPSTKSVARRRTAALPLFAPCSSSADVCA